MLLPTIFQSALNSQDISKHIYSAAQAKTMIVSKTSLMGPNEIRAFHFPKAAILRLLNQPGAVGLRIHKAVHLDGTETVVLTATNSTNTDLLNDSNIAIQAADPCPPTCGKDDTE